MERHGRLSETARAGRLTIAIIPQKRSLTSPPAMVIRLTSTTVSAIGTALLLMLVVHLSPDALSAAAEEAESTSLPNWGQVIDAHQDWLARVESDAGARDVFVNAVGRAAALHDVAGTLAVQGMSPKLVKELMVPEISTSAQRLIAALVAWRLADHMMQTLEGKVARTDGVPLPAQVAWLAANGPFPSLDDAVKRWEAGDTTAAAGAAAGHMAQEAGRQAMEEWWRLKTWKDRVRSTRGQSRLCGTWQWVIHNHQRHHEEQKLSLVFPPPGHDGGRIPGLAETVVLGDVVYLRWERDGKVQEDSLLFSKEGQRLEGTFINSQGGWGSISGKRTASCGP
ncbi:MAG TPA: hypothetical protein VJL88_08395 [Nitrospira sp.]|nr:hypothetical protein [Nitrospira sp.]